MDSKRRSRPSLDALGRRLLTLRTLAGLTQAGLAERVGVSARSILKWEGGESAPSEPRLRQLIEAFVAQQAFTAGQERAEAEALWEDIRQAAGKRLPPFAAAWFEGLLVQQAPKSAGSLPPASSLQSPPASHPPSSIVDWGDALDAPTLHGREAELATLQQSLLADRCRVVALLGLGGIGKTSLALTFARLALPHFEVVLFRSLRNAPPPAEVIGQMIGAVSLRPAALPDDTHEKIALLIQLLRARRCLLVLDNLETIIEAGARDGEYRAGYADYGTLIQRIGEAQHQSCLLLTSREKPAELAPLEGRTAPVRSLTLAGLSDQAGRTLLAEKDVVGPPSAYAELVRLYGGNPLALKLASEPIHALFGGDLQAFLQGGNLFFNGIGELIEQQFARSTPLEQAILYWLAIEREPTALGTLLPSLGGAVPPREVLRAIESLRRRLLIERSPDNPAFTLQPVILEYLTEQLASAICQELLDAAPKLLISHAIVQATAKEYLRHSQERLIAAPLLERLLAACGGGAAAQQRLVALLNGWRGLPHAEQGYGPGNISTLLRILRGDLSGLDLSHLALQHLYLQGVAAHDTSLVGSHLARAVFQEPFAGVESVACSPDMRYLAVGTVNGEVRLWEVASRTTLLALQAHAGPVVGLALSASGRLLASGSSDGTIRLWDVPSGASLAVLRGHTSVVWNVALSADGRLLASGDGDGTVQLWDVPSGRNLATLEGHTSAVRSIALSADERLLASGSYDGSVRLWDVSAALSSDAHRPACLAVLRDHTAGVYAVALSADGRLLVSGSADHTIRVWDTAGLLDVDARSPSCLATLMGHTDAIRTIALSQDGRLAASGSGQGKVRLWEIPSGRSLAILEGHTNAIMSIAMSADGQRLASGSTDGTLRLWDVPSGRVLATVEGLTNAIMCVALAADALVLASGSTDGTVRLWDVASGAGLGTLRGHSSMVMGVAFSPDRRLLASGSGDGTVRLWDAGRGTSLVRLEGHTNVVRDIAWSADGRLLASGSYDGTVRLWDMSIDQGTGLPNSTTLATLHSHTDMVMGVAFSADARLLASASSDGTIRLWDTSPLLGADRRPPIDLAILRDHTAAVYKVALSADGRLLASSSFDRSVRLWDMLAILDTGRPSPASLALLEDHTSAIWSIGFSPDGRLLAIGDADGALQLWDVPSRASLAALKGHTSAVWGVALSLDGRLLASGSTDGTVRLWDSPTGALVRTLRPERTYERMNIAGLTGITEAQRASLLALGAVDGPGDPQPAPLASIDRAPSRAAQPDTLAQPPAQGRRGAALGLPFQPTPFIGRDDELAEIARIFGDPACRLLTLLGPGGIGKTRLAIEAATQQNAAFADGAAFVALAAVGTPSQMISAIGDTLRLTYAGQADPAAHLLGYLRDRHMLLILDNFEHLLAGADLVYDILAQAPRVKLLVTSRERLSLQAEWLFDVEGLAYPPEDPRVPDTPQPDSASYSAIQLFVQRATQVLPRLPLTEETLATIVRICRHVAGMPLAIELAAAGVRGLAIGELEQQIRANLDTLATAMRDVPVRHRGMRVVFEHSWSRLAEQERVLLSRLAVFRGGCTAAAVEQVVGGELAALVTLVGKSLLRQSRAEARQGAVANAEESRFALLEPIREYALEQLAVRGEVAALQHAHASYYLALAESVAAAWDSPAAEAAIAQLDREYDNMRAALQWARDGGDRTIGLGLGRALRRFWQRRGYYSEGRVWLDELLALDDDRADSAATVARLHALDTAAWLASDQHDFARASQLSQQSMALRRQLGETEGEPHLLLNAARQARAAGLYQQAITLFEEALARQRASGDRGSASAGGLGQSLYDLALVRREQGDFAQAAALLQEGIELHREIGEREGIAVGLLGLGDLARDQGDAPQLRRYTEQSLAISRELGIQWAIGFALNNLALADYLEGDLAQASARASESVALFRSFQAEGSLGEVMLSVGQIARAQGHAAAAYEVFVEALRLALTLGPRLIVPAALEGLGSLAALAGQAELAARLLGVAAVLRSQMGTPVRPVDHAAVEHALAAARTALGAQAFAVVWASAAELPLDQLLDIARSGVPNHS